MLFAGIVIKEGLGEFLSPRAPAASCPLLPSHRSRAWTKHRADGLTRRRSDLSLLLLFHPSRRHRLSCRFSRTAAAAAAATTTTAAPQARSLSFLRVLLPRSPLQQPSTRPTLFLYPVCHFVPPLARACRSLPPHSFPLTHSLFLSISLSLFMSLISSCVFTIIIIFFFGSASFFFLGSLIASSRRAKTLPQNSRATLPSEEEKERERGERYVWNKRVFARSTRNQKRHRNDKGSDSAHTKGRTRVRPGSPSTG